MAADVSTKGYSFTAQRGTPDGIGEINTNYVSISGGCIIPMPSEFQKITPHRCMLIRRLIILIQFMKSQMLINNGNLAFGRITGNEIWTAAASDPSIGLGADRVNDVLYRGLGACR